MRSIWSAKAPGGLVRRSPLEEEQPPARAVAPAHESVPRSDGLTPVQMDRLPDCLKRVVVVSSTGRSCGYLDSDGLWRSDFSNEELDDVIGWQEL